MNTRKPTPVVHTATDDTPLRSDRRDFLGATLGIGTGGLLAGLGLSQYVAAQSAPPAARAAVITAISAAAGA